MPQTVWDILANLKIQRPLPPAGRRAGRRTLAAELARRFGLKGSSMSEPLYRDFHFSVASGEIVAVVGPSGAGKTALLNEVASVVGDAITLDVGRLAGSNLPAIECLDGDGDGLRRRRAKARGPRRSARRRRSAGAIACRAGRLGESLQRRLAILSRCGLAEAPALLTPARRLSAGQLFRLALAAAIWRAGRGTGPKRDEGVPAAKDGGGVPSRLEPQSRPRLLLVDEFGATLDAATGEVLARQMGKLARRHNLGMIISTNRQELLPALSPARVIVKPLGAPPELVEVSKRGEGVPAAKNRGGVPARLEPLAWRSPKTGCGPVAPNITPRRGDRALRWRVTRGRIADYRALAQFHYVAGPPAAHKRVWTVRTPRALRCPGAPEIAAVLVVSPPVLNCRGRNVATAGRYAKRPGGLARLNAEVECISRVIVHPMFRSCGLAVRLVRHALKTASAPLVEALASMGSVHPFFELAGMTCFGEFEGRTICYCYYLHGARKPPRRRKRDASDRSCKERALHEPAGPGHC